MEIKTINIILENLKKWYKKMINKSKSSVEIGYIIHHYHLNH